MSYDFADRLLIWFHQHGRQDLPWQQDISPYRVWISEIMLQQTQVATVIPYYKRFLKAFPSVELLAQADEDAVLHQWTGLGYYARARNLHKTAKLLMTRFDGEFPLEVKHLTALPGIGKSTAGAIVATCTDRKAVILDGNVKRVLSRCFAIAGWPGHPAVAAQLWQKAEALTPVANVADYTQAIMDLGAMVCTRRRPNCSVCPFEDTCVANRTRQIEAYPGRKPKKELPVQTTIMLVIENYEGHILLEKRPSRGLWGGLWSFPEIPDSESIEDYLQAGDMVPVRIETLPKFRHSFTHFHFDITPVHIQIADANAVNQDSGSRCWYSPSNPVELGLTRPVTKILTDLLRPHSSDPIPPLLRPLYNHR